MERVCLVCWKAPERPMFRFTNSAGISIYIHDHHRILTICRAGIEVRLAGQKRSRSQRSFVESGRLA